MNTFNPTKWTILLCSSALLLGPSSHAQLGSAHVGGTVAPAAPAGGATRVAPTTSSGSTTTPAMNPTSPVVGGVVSNGVGVGSGTVLATNGGMIGTTPGVSPGAVVSGSTQPAVPAVGGTIGAQGNNPAPTIVGTVHGLRGSTFFVGSDDQVFFRTPDGAMHPFGHLQNKLPGLQGQFAAQNGLITNAAGAVVPNPTPGVTANPGTSQIPPLTTGLGGTLTNGLGGTINPGTTPPLGSHPAGFTNLNGVNATGQANPGQVNGQVNGQPTIVGTVMGTGGKTYFIGSDGFIYFRGSDGGLHVFGTAVPKAE